MNINDIHTWLEVITAVGSFLSGIGMVLGVVALVYLIRQTRANERATTATVYQSIVVLGNSINDMFVNDPELYCEIFGTSANFTAATVEEEQGANPRRFFAALKWLDYFETIFVLWPAIPENLYEPWRSYIRDHLYNSTYIRRIVLESTWYGDDLVALCREAHHATSPNHAMQHTSSARHSGCNKPAYPPTAGAP